MGSSAAIEPDVADLGSAARTPSLPPGRRLAGESAKKHQKRNVVSDVPVDPGLDDGGTALNTRAAIAGAPRPTVFGVNPDGFQPLELNADTGRPASVASRAVAAGPQRINETTDEYARRQALVPRNNEITIDVEAPEGIEIDVLNALADLGWLVKGAKINGRPIDVTPYRELADVVAGRVPDPDAEDEDAEEDETDEDVETSLDRDKFASEAAFDEAVARGLTPADFTRKRKSSEGGFTKSDVTAIADAKEE